MTAPIGPGAFIAVVGASGVGKDALLSYARSCTDDVAYFPRRAITRPAGPGEDHDPLGAGAFAEACARDAFAVRWHAHGLDYGIPSRVDDEVRSGRSAVANVSRGVLGLLAERYGRLVVVRVTVSDEVRAARLHGRRRETASDIAARLGRPDPAPDHPVDVEIRNDGSLERAGDLLVRVIRDAARPPTA